MAMLPVRKLGSLGVLTDVDTYDLPPQAYSFAKNIRIENGSTSRGAVFRNIGALANNPAHLRGFFDSGGNPYTIYSDTSGKLYTWNAGVETDITTSGWTPTVSAAPVTSVVLNNMIYINRQDHIPWVRTVDSTGAFAGINTGAAQWDSTYRAQSIRAMNAMVIALNITKGAVRYPTMVKWSGFSTFNAQPADWDITSTTSSAGENTLSQMDGALVDGCLLRDRMMLYGTKETWAMDYIGGNDIFAFTRLFDFGVIGTNCVIEHEDEHYVFGVYDIKKTDGITAPVSIADKRTRKFIYDGLVKSQSNYFFVTHGRNLNEIMFCYVSNDPYTLFPSTGGNGCNRGAIYNYAEDAWYFADLPYVTCADALPPGTGAIWSAETAIDWTDFGGSWSAQIGDTKLNLVFGSIASGSVTRSLRTFDRVESVSTTFPIDAGANGGAYIEKDNINLDLIKADLRGYKLTSSVYPLCNLSTNAAPLRFSVGFSDSYSIDPTWGTDQTFDQTFYKLDYNIAGRFLSFRMFQDDFQEFKLSGLDIDVTILGEF